MVTTSQLTGSEYQPAGRLDDAGGSPSHMDIPIHRATLLSGELHARLDPVAFPQNGVKYAGTVAGVVFPAVGIPLARDTVDANPTALATPAGAVRPSWTGVPVRSADQMGILDGWGVSVAGHKSYKVVLELANGQSPVSQFAATTFNAPQVGLTTSLNGGNIHNVINAIYVIHAEDTALPANALLIQRFAAAYVAPTGPSFSVAPVKNGSGLSSGTVHIPGTVPGWHIGVTYATGTADPHYFAFSTVNAPVDYNLAGQIDVAGQGGTLTEVWVSTTNSRADAVLVAAV